MSKEAAFKAIKFIHLRQYNIPEGSEGKFDAVRVLSPKGGGTIAYYKFKDPDNQEEKIHAGFSYCSDQDAYNKHKGRSASSGRLASQRHFYIGTPPEDHKQLHNFLIDRWEEQRPKHAAHRFEVSRKV